MDYGPWTLDEERQKKRTAEVAVRAEIIAENTGAHSFLSALRSGLGGYYADHNIGYTRHTRNGDFAHMFK